jgi:hypothetical protein
MKHPLMQTDLKLLLSYKEVNTYYYLSNLKLNKLPKAQNSSNMYPFMKTIECHSIFGIFKTNPVEVGYSW